MCCMLSVIIVRSSIYIVVVHVKGDVLNWYLMSSFSNHLRKGSRKMMNKYGLGYFLVLFFGLFIMGVLF